jgi:hypothetical protein
MPFLGPWLLMGILGAAGAAVPIVLHFFFRSRYRNLPWAAMEFLLTSIEQTSRRLRFQELLLLLMRCALLLLLAFALARPALSGFLRSASGSRDAVDAIFLIDNSFSMGAREGARTRIDLAKSAALNALDQLPPHSSVQIVTFGDDVSQPLLRDSGNLEEARKIIEELEPSSLATDLAPALAYAVRALKVGQAANRELYIFTDCQKQAFAQKASEVNALLEDAKAVAAIYLVRCGTRALANVAVVEIVPQKDIPRPGQRVGFAVVVKNTGSSAIRPFTVSLAVDGDARNAASQVVPDLGPGQSYVAALTARVEKPGLHVMTAWVQGDDLPGDNYLDRVVDVRESVRALVVDGSPNPRDPDRSSSFHLVGALVPTHDSVLQADVVAPRLAGGELLHDKAVCILCNVALAADQPGNPEAPTTEFLDALADFVKKGGALLIYAGDRVLPEVYSQALGNRGLLPTRIVAVREFSPDDNVVIDRKSAAPAAFQHLAQDRYYEHFDKFLILKTLQLAEPARETEAPAGTDPGRVLMRYSNGLPAITAAKVGQGEVMIVGTSADPGFKPRSLEPTWNYLFFFQQGYLPLVQAQMNYLLAGQSQTYNATVGESLRYVPPMRQAERSFLLITPGKRQEGGDRLLPEGPRIPLGMAQREAGQNVVIASGLTRAGVYYLTTRERDGEGEAEGEASRLTAFAVAPDLRESADLETMSDEEIDRQLGFAPTHFTAVEGQEVVFAAARTNREWTVWCLVLVLLVAIAEAVLAWYCGRAW